jgi:hypothetical protein
MAADQSFGFQFSVGVRNRCTVDAELAGKFAARRDAVSGAKLAGMHQRAQLIAKLHVQRYVTFRL